MDRSKVGRENAQCEARRIRLPPNTIFYKPRQIVVGTLFGRQRVSLLNDRKEESFRLSSRILDVSKAIADDTSGGESAGVERMF